MGIPMNNDSAKKWHQCGRHVRQKEPAPSAEVRRTTPEVACAPPDTSSYVAGVEIQSSLRLHTRLKLAEALPTTPMSIVQRPTCLDLATLPCHGTHQTGMPLVRGELPEHSGRDHTSTPCTLSIAPVQSEGCRASKATVNRLRPPSTIGYSALPC